MINHKIIGSKIRTFRKQKKLSQYDLADLMFMDQGSISLIERGKRTISAPSLFRFAEVLQVSVYDFGVWNNG